MENNKIIIEENGESVEYKVLLNMEDVNGKNYVVYTKDERNIDGEKIVYAGEYIENKEKNTFKLISIKEDSEWELIKDIINSLK